MEATFYIINDEVLANCQKAIAKGQIVQINPKGKTRPQEKYFHAILNIVAKHQGEDPEDMKDDIKIRVLGGIERVYKGNVYMQPNSSKNISDDQYSKMIDAVLMMASFLNVRIPPRPYYGIEER